jgi:Arylsulfotransferase (ASST)
VRGVKTRSRLRGRVALASLVIAAIAVGVVTAQRRAAAHVTRTVRAINPTTVATYPRSAASKPLWCKLQHRRFHTLPGFRPEGICVARHAGMRVADDKILVTPRPDPRRNRGEQYGPMILSSKGWLLWYEPRPYKVHDLKQVTYRGRPALAFFQVSKGGGYYQLLDRHYEPIAQVRTGHGFQTNLHELQVTPQGTAYVSADVPVQVPRIGTVIEYVVQEVDIATGDVLFEWRSLDHVPPSDSYERRPGHGKPWDYFHGNAIAAPVDGDPTVIISSRNTSSLYGVDRATGSTSWILGGKRDQFHLPRSRFFCAQHDAHRLPNGDVMMFDNGGTYMHGRPRCPLHAARALTFRLDTRHRTARLVHEISSAKLPGTPSGLFPGWVGSARMESNGDTLIDWGPPNRITSITPAGRLGLLVRVQRWSYRAMPADWTGLPGGAPALAAHRRGGVVDLWASWNGATEIRHWQVLAGASPASLGPLGRPVPFEDLETHVAAETSARYVAVRALAADGRVLGGSAAVRP